MGGGGGKGGGGGGGGEMPDTMTTISKWSPPDYLGGKNGALSSYMSYAGQVLGKPFNQYMGQQQGGPSTDTQMGWQIARQRALNGNPLAKVADNQFTNTMNGAYLGHQAQTNPFGFGNPYLNNAINYATGDVSRNYAQSVAPQLQGAFARNKAFGGSAYEQQLGESQRQLAQELGRVNSDMRMQDYGQQQQLAENAINRNENAYQSERGRQMGMMGYADQAGQRDFNDAQMLMNIGQQKGNYLQGVLNGGQQDFNSANNFLNDNMSRYQSVIGGLTGQGNSTTTSTNPNAYGGGTNKLAGGLGGAMSGYSLGGMLGQSGLGQSMIAGIPGLQYSQMPWIGAGIGGLVGALGK